MTFSGENSGVLALAQRSGRRVHFLCLKIGATRPTGVSSFLGTNAALLSLKVFDDELDGIPRTPCGIPANRGQSAENRDSIGNLPNRHDPHGF
jgi:hypothetical protein